MPSGNVGTLLAYYMIGIDDSHWLLSLPFDQLAHIWSFHLSRDFSAMLLSDAAD
jgi:hypothetical protein